MYTIFLVNVYKILNKLCHKSMKYIFDFQKKMYRCRYSFKTCIISISIYLYEFPHFENIIIINNNMIHDLLSHYYFNNDIGINLRYKD